MFVPVVNGILGVSAIANVEDDLAAGEPSVRQFASHNLQERDDRVDQLLVHKL